MRPIYLAPQEFSIRNDPEQYICVLISFLPPLLLTVPYW